MWQVYACGVIPGCEDPPPPPTVAPDRWDSPWSLCPVLTQATSWVYYLNLGCGVFFTNACLVALKYLDPSMYYLKRF